MPMGNVWAWPSERLSVEKTLVTMIGLAYGLVRLANDYDGWGHPLQITTDLETSSDLLANAVTAATAAVAGESVGVMIPRLAQLVAVSPLEAAIHDAYGKALGENSYNLLGPEFVSRDLSAWLGDEFAGEYLDRYTLRQPKPRMPLYHLVGALDPLTAADVAEPRRRRAAGNASSVDRPRRPDALENQARGRRPGLGRGAGGRG